jgi:DNA polymerase V
MFLPQVAGDALAADGIHDGDLLVVDRALPPPAGSVVMAVAVAWAG